MHKDIDITLDNLCKIEGEASLDIKIKDKKVEKAELKITQNKRFYSEAIRGKSFNMVPQTVSRVCGTCSISHVLASIKAIEDAYKIKVSKQTLILRELGMLGQMIRDHAMHLYLFVLPDMLGKQSVFDFDAEHKELIHKAFHIKNAGNLLSKFSVGRAVHPTTAIVGGILNVGDKELKKKTLEELKENRESAVEFVKYFDNENFVFSRKTKYLALHNKGYDFSSGDLLDTSGYSIKVCDLGTHLSNVVVPYAQSEVFELDKEEYFTGALARMNVNKKYIHKNTKKDLSKFIKKFPSDNIFDNNLAQAIELVHSMDTAIDLLESNDFKKEEPKKVNTGKKVSGVGVIEAPRGTLYYHIDIDEKGKVIDGDLVIPTAQNQVKLHNDIRIYVTQLLEKGFSKDKIQKHIEALIRAYDPCMSCGSNFLRVNWL